MTRSLPTIIRALTTHGIGTTGALSAIPYAAAVIAMIVGSTVSDRLERRVVFVWPFLLIAGICFVASYFLRSGSFTISFILLIVAAAGMYALYGPYFAHIPEILPAADAGPATGMINAFGGLGGFAGVYVVGLLGGGDSALPFAFLAICLILAALLMFAVRHPSNNSSQEADAQSG